MGDMGLFGLVPPEWAVIEQSPKYEVTISCNGPLAQLVRAAVS